MTRREVIATLVKAFKALRPEQKRRLMYHHECGASILCGEEDYKYFERGGVG